MSLFIIKLEEAKRDLGIEDREEDAAIEAWLEGLQGRIESHLDRALLRSENETVYADGGERTIYLRRWPVEELSVREDADKIFGDDTLLVENIDYHLSERRGRLRRVGADWVDGDEVVRIVSTAGYQACGAEEIDGREPMPEAIRRAALMQFGFEWRNRDKLGITQFDAKGHGASFSNPVDLARRQMTLLPEVETTLEPFRRILL